MTMEENTFEYNFDKLCRACKVESQDLRSIFDKSEECSQITATSPKLADMLMVCTSVQVEPGDGLPSAMCLGCIQQLTVAYQFKTQCENTDSSLRLLLKGGGIKQEAGYCDDLNDSALDFPSYAHGDEPIKTEADESPSEISIFACNICAKRFATSSGLRFHKRTHNDTSDSLTCKICSKEFEFQSHLQRHLRVHNPQKIFVCKICDKRLTRLEHLKRHMIIHLKTKPHVCKICKRGFNHVDNLFNHEKRCKGDRTYVCEICNRGFNRPDGLEAHMSNHDSSVDIKPMLDSLDNIERYIQVENLDSNELHEFFEPQVDILETELGKPLGHTIGTVKSEKEACRVDDDDDEDDEGMKMDSDPEWNEQVEIPEKRKRGRPRKGEVRTAIKRPLSARMMKMKRTGIDYMYNSSIYNCRVCQKKFKRSSHLKRHMLCHGENKPFVCHICTKTFTRRDHMLRHVKLHTIKKEFKCDICDREFSKEDQLMQHKAIKHDIGERTFTEKKYKCDICHKSFTTEKYRDIHVKAHSEEKEKIYRCKTCEHTFNTKTDLLDHEKKNSECSKKYLCSECGQRFIRKNYLVVHMRRHRGEKPYKCKFCGKGFPRSTDVTRHEKYHTGEKNHLCIVCGKGFGRYVYPDTRK